MVEGKERPTTVAMNTAVIVLPSGASPSYETTESADMGSGGPPLPPTARTRRRQRFTSEQLMMLEQLFHETSHPTREQRERLAREFGMVPKSVTIWMQNRRQAERKSAMLQSAAGHPPRHPPVESKPLTSPPPPPPRSSSTEWRPFTRTGSTRPTLDLVATRSEHVRRSSSARARSRSDDLSRRSSSEQSSSDRDRAARLQTELKWMMRSRNRTNALERACEAALLRPVRDVDAEGDETELEETDEDEDGEVEAVTPGSSFVGDSEWKGEEEKTVVVEDEDVMRGALLLCGLGRR